MLLTNGRIFAAAGITRHTPDPPGGRIVKGADGEPAGLLIDTAQRLVQDVQPLPSGERFETAVREAIAECLAKGLTGLHEMGADLEGHRAGAHHGGRRRGLPPPAGLAARGSNAQPRIARHARKRVRAAALPPHPPFLGEVSEGAPLIISGPPPMT